MRTKRKADIPDLEYVCFQKFGLLERIRTSDTRLRRAVLCPAELQAEMFSLKINFRYEKYQNNTKNNTNY